MERVKDGDANAFASLYDRHAALAFAIARSVCRDTSLAEEAVQEGFLSIWRGRDSYRRQVEGSFRGWAMKVIRHRAIDIYRSLHAEKRPPTSSVPVEDVVSVSCPSALDQVLARSQHDELEGLMLRLPKSQAAVISLAFLHGMTHPEIAAHLDLPPGTVKGRIRLGLEKLRRDGEGVLGVAATEQIHARAIRSTQDPAIIS